MNARFLRKHDLASYLQAMLSRGHDPQSEGVKIVRFYPSDQDEVICEVEAPSEGALGKWLKAINCSPSVKSTPAQKNK